MPNENKNVNERFKVLQSELASSKKKLSELNSEKEKWFERKEELKKKVGELVKKAKKLREEKEKVNSRVKDFKNKRDKQNFITKDKIEKVKGLRGKVDFNEKRISSGFLKKDIEKLEMKIETEALSFSNEKKIMKDISKLRQEYKKAKEARGVAEDKKKIDREIDDSKKKAGESHTQVRDLSKESKKKHETYLNLSKEIKELNMEQEKAFDNFLKFKEGFNKLSKERDRKLKELDKIKEKKERIKFKAEKKKEDIKKNILVKKAEGVEEKLKKGEKLTREDLIKFQGGND